LYVPGHFDASDVEWCHARIREEPFGTLVTADHAGVPFATHIPFLLDADRGPRGTLLGHVARGNPHAGVLASHRPALAIFQGPHAYVSPSWYGVHPSVPTWNYVAVHAYGVPAVIDDPAHVRAIVARLVETHEAGQPVPWRIDALPEDYLTGMLRGIVAFEMPIERLEGKAKLSQNRSEDDRARVRTALADSGEPLATAVAALMSGPAPRH
jgi:transcriptional regulator